MPRRKTISDQDKTVPLGSDEHDNEANIIGAASTKPKEVKRHIADSNKKAANNKDVDIEKSNGTWKPDIAIKRRKYKARNSLQGVTNGCLPSGMYSEADTSKNGTQTNITLGKRSRSLSGQAVTKAKRKRCGSSRNVNPSESPTTGPLIDALDILKKHTEHAEESKRTSNSSMQTTSYPDEPVPERSPSSETKTSAEDNKSTSSKGKATIAKTARKQKAAQQTTHTGIGIRVRKNRLDERVNNPKLKDSQRLTAIASSFELEDRLMNAPRIPMEDGSSPVVNGEKSITKLSNTTGEKNYRRTHSGSMLKATKATTGKKKAKPRLLLTLPSFDDDTLCEDENISLPNSLTSHKGAATQDFSKDRLTKSQSKNSQALTGKRRGRKRKSGQPTTEDHKTSNSESAFSKTNNAQLAYLKSPFASERLSATEDIDEDDDITLPELHKSTQTSEYNRAKTGMVAESSESSLSVTNHIKNATNAKTSRLYCDWCDFFVDSVKVMAFHQKGHSLSLKQSQANDTRSKPKAKERGECAGRRGRGRRGHARSRTVDTPVHFPLANKTKLGKRKASFDPNVDEDATETDLFKTYRSGEHSSASTQPGAFKLSENGCLTPSDSDDEDLPDVSFSSSQDSINKGDVVWVKYRGAPFWPAVVMQVYMKKGRVVKLTIVFIGSMGVRNTDPAGTRPWFKKLGIAYKSDTVVPFGTRNDELKHRAYASEFSKALGESILTADNYVQQKAFGQVTDHEEFFAEDIGTAEVRFMQKLEAEGALDEETLRQVIPQVPRPPSSDEEDEEEVEEEKVKEHSENDSPKPVTKADEKRQKWRHDQSLKIVEKMTSKPCLDYLDKIYNGTVESELHEKYNSATTNKKKHELAISHGYGPILDEHWEGMIVKMAEHTNSKYGKDVLSLSTYLLDVWVPEAIVYAIQRVRKISKEKAEIVFRNGIRQTKKEREESSKAMIRNHKNIAPEDQERYNAKNRRFLEENFPGCI